MALKTIGAYDGTDVPPQETALRLNREGLSVSSSDKKGRNVLITPDRFEGIFNNGLTGSKDEIIFGLNEESVFTKEVVTENGADFITMRMTPVTYSEHRGIAFVKSSREKLNS